MGQKNKASVTQLAWAS